MLITHDYSYINSSKQYLVDLGLAQISVHSINFDRYFTEEEKEENYKQAQLLGSHNNSEAWLKRCDETSERIYNQMLPIAELLNSRYNMHQYTLDNSSSEHYRSDWDLFWYSNKGWNGKDIFDHIQISLNENRTVEQNAAILENILNLLKEQQANNVSCRVQYNVIENKELISEYAKTIFNNIQDKWITFSGMIGKVKIIENSYAFIKKNSKKKYYRMNPCDLVNIA